MSLLRLGSASAVVLLLTAGLAALAGEPAKGIACKYKSEHHGNTFSMYTWLEVGGPDTKTWRYAWKTDTVYRPGSARELNELTGTYERVGDLVVVTGQANVFVDGKKAAHDVRFAVNTGIAQGHVQFNRFFPVEDGMLRLHRQWFARRGGQWQPLEERLMSFPATAAKKDVGTWQVPLTVERTRWDKDGKKSVERFAKTITYTKTDLGRYQPAREPAPPWWLLGDLQPQFAGERVEAVAYASGYGHELAGIDPQIADEPMPPPAP